MAINDKQTFTIKPKLKPTTKKSSSTPEQKYWKSFKSKEPQPLISSITSLAFSPTSPHDFAATHSATVTIFSSQTLQPKSTISAFKDTATSGCFRSDGLLLAAGSLSGLIQIFDVKKRAPLRKLSGHTRPVHFVTYPRVDKLHLFSGGDDSVVKYWEVWSGTHRSFTGHKDYVRCGDGSPVNDHMFVSGSYDHTVKFWDVRESSNSSALVLSVDHGAPVEDVVYLPSGGLVASAGGNSVKIWDVIGGGKLLHSMECHNKTVTKLCVAKIGDDGRNGDFGNQFRIMSVSLDGYLKVFDYSRLKVTSSIRYPKSLMSVAFSPDGSTRVVGSSNGDLYAGKRKTSENAESVKSEWGKYVGFGAIDEPEKRVLRPSYFRYFHRGQSEKPSKGDYIITRPKKVKLAEHDKLLKKFHHKEALVAALTAKNPENVVAVMEELVSRKKLLKCVSNLGTDELGLLLSFLQKYSTMPRYANVLIVLAKKVVENRVEDISGSEELKGYVRNLKRSVAEEIRIQESLQEIQGMISPLLKIAGRR
ncbi:putative transcription factor WD40-like family [Helianthus annuus]|uniref:Putative transducin family protein / WD-40 repeat family protein n=1 Tax=Helianthus annuus TaxID=4232 RepID=A0A251T9M3_HELAN|nr:protein SLOW WALKER 1 [Helianthus annuus]KAF5782575.1 putative transcription factor WD40-like family [Helianthus annuus]KAJ0502049.1 putative transcription factor WD40-like family [Helianthus annuus]KAJ0510010.1 putative transcription factor WD40-like family [Helianthus annuus]KAJ0517973.1 putative transcription factor WD40-like family [Helianthus annuus]KAJ0685992.1 putative transcription factor WD40-like family [Helianthus annuus]